MSKKISLGQFIASRRKFMHLTQETLAERIGVSKSAIAKWETNGGIPDRDNLKRIAETLNLSVCDIYRIIEHADTPYDELDINITQDVIAILESYGYKVIRPNNKNQ